MKALLLSNQSFRRTLARNHISRKTYGSYIQCPLPGFNAGLDLFNLVAKCITTARYKVYFVIKKSLYFALYVVCLRVTQVTTRDAYRTFLRYVIYVFFRARRCYLHGAHRSTADRCYPDILSDIVKDEKHKYPREKFVFFSLPLRYVRATGKSSRGLICRPRTQNTSRENIKITLKCVFSYLSIFTIYLLQTEYTCTVYLHKMKIMEKVRIKANIVNVRKFGKQIIDY